MAHQAGSRDKGGSTVDIYYFNHINEILGKGPSQIKTITDSVGHRSNVVRTFEETAVESITGISKSRRLGVSSFRNIPTAMKSTTGIVPKSGNELKVGETRREGAQRECLESKFHDGPAGRPGSGRENGVLIFGIPKEVGTATGFSEP
ncbi:hypothetical protein B0H11DRAFT_1898748 [Mycena galericulata]|nr:hypothetical protein B0H11DRAFT_1898748 [Mycena galericulata]